ncbi:MAG: hypothetical protein ACLFO1_08465 [Spirochaetaceae bacterium]
MYTRQVRRALLIPTALFCIIISFLAIASAIDLFRTLILMEWKGFFAVALVLLILVLGIAELLVLFGIYYWLAASKTERHMAKRASLTCTVLFFVMSVSSLGKVLRYLVLDLGFFEVADVTGPYPHIGFFLGAGGFLISLVAFLVFNRLLRNELGHSPG